MPGPIVILQQAIMRMSSDQAVVLTILILSALAGGLLYCFLRGVVNVLRIWRRAYLNSPRRLRRICRRRGHALKLQRRVLNQNMTVWTFDFFCSRCGKEFTEDIRRINRGTMTEDQIKRKAIPS